MCSGVGAVDVAFTALEQQMANRRSSSWLFVVWFASTNETSDCVVTHFGSYLITIVLRRESEACMA